MLFINNIVPWRMGDQCIGWVWYLANDFQFFLISPVIIWMYCKFRKGGYIALVTLQIACFISTFTTAYVGNFGAGMNSPKAKFNDDLIYERPWTRFGPFGVGAIFGLIYFEFTQREKPEFSDSLMN